jgi:hypothetical protein
MLRTALYGRGRVNEPPNELRDRIGNIVVDTIGVADGLETLTARLWEMMDGHYQALLDIADYAVEPGADPMRAVIEIQKIAVQGLGRDGRGGFIPVYGTRPRD